MASRSRSDPKKKEGGGLLLFGILLIVAGILLALGQYRPELLGWAARLLPLILMAVGIIRIIGFASRRRPRSAFGGSLLVIAGAAMLIVRENPGMGPLQLYGRYWPLLLALFAAVKIVRHYSDRSPQRRPGPISPGQVFIAGAIILSGLLANKLAAKGSWPVRIKLPRPIAQMRDLIGGRPYTFSDQITIGPLSAGSKLRISNDYGDIIVEGGADQLRAALIKRVRAWDMEGAQRAARQISLQVDRTGDALQISVKGQIESFGADVRIETPSAVELTLIGSHGSQQVARVRGPLQINASNGRIAIRDIVGAVNLNVEGSDIEAKNIVGDLKIVGAGDASIYGVDGSVELSARRGRVEMRQVSGPVSVDATMTQVVAQELGQPARIETSHSEVRISRAADVIVRAPHSDVRASDCGRVEIVSSHSDIEVSRIGPLKLSAEHCSLVAADVEGPVEVYTSHGDVSLKRFRSSVRVQTSYADVTLVAVEAPSSDIEVENYNGDIELWLPRSSQFELEAESRGGRVRSYGFDMAAGRSRGSLSLVVGSDGPKIRLKTSNRNITIRATGLA